MSDWRRSISCPRPTSRMDSSKPHLHFSVARLVTRSEERSFGPWLLCLQLRRVKLHLHLDWRSGQVHEVAASCMQRGNLFACRQWLILVAAAGLEPARPIGPGILSALSLPFLQAAIGPALAGHFRSFNLAQMAYVWLSPNTIAIMPCNRYIFHNRKQDFKSSSLSFLQPSGPCFMVRKCLKTRHNPFHSLPVYSSP